MLGRITILVKNGIVLKPACILEISKVMSQNEDIVF